MKIGIIGSGIGGLVAAYRFKARGHEVVLFEKQSRVGMSVHALGGLAGRIEQATDFADLPAAVDVPSRLCNALQWPDLLALYRQAGVEIVPVSSDQTYADDRGQCYLKFDPESAFDRAAIATGLSGIPGFYSNLNRLRASAESDLQGGLSHEITLEEYLVRENVPSELKFGFLYPLLSSTVCTCSFDAIGRYPAQLILGMLRDLNSSGGSEESRLVRTRFGTQDVVDKLLCGQPDLILEAEVKEVRDLPTGVEVELDPSSQCSDDRPLLFDHVIIATQANHAAKLLPDSLMQEQLLLARFEYEDVEVVVHRDENLLPARKGNWSTFNFALNNTPVEARQSTCHIWLNRFYDVSFRDGENWFQTINPVVPPRREMVVGRVILQRPVITPDNYPAWAALDDMQQQPERRIWFVGSYAAVGVPLLESGVVSASRVVERIEMAGAGAT